MRKNLGANRTYLRVGGKAGTAFSDGNQLK